MHLLVEQLCLRLSSAPRRDGPPYSPAGGLVSFDNDQRLPKAFCEAFLSHIHLNLLSRTSKAFARRCLHQLLRHVFPWNLNCWKDVAFNHRVFCRSHPTIRSGEGNIQLCLIFSIF